MHLRLRELREEEGRQHQAEEQGSSHLDFYELSTMAASLTVLCVVAARTSGYSWGGKYLSTSLL